MSTRQLELGDTGEMAPCDCCGAKSRTAHGFVYRGGDAYAVYYAGWSDGPPGRGVSLAIAVGEWAEVGFDRYVANGIVAANAK